MNEITIDLKQIEPILFFGEQDANLNQIKKFYPKLKIIGRGNLLIAYGKEELLQEFKDKVNQILHYLKAYNSINERELKVLMKDESYAKDMTTNAPQSIIIHGINGKKIEAQTLNQKKIVSGITKVDLLFVIGPAGTGKTYTSVAMAVKYLKEKKVKRIILTRPAVEAGENLGFLPGDLKDKLDPYMQPLYDALRDMIPASRLESFIEDGTIQIAPLAFMRGRTLGNAFVILDEAQNTTSAQMKMFLTRMGLSSKFIVTGDPGQIDLATKYKPGLTEATELMKNVSGIEVVTLDKTDIIRHTLVEKVVDAYEKKKNTK